MGEIDPLFEVHTLTEGGIAKAQTIARTFNDCLTTLRTLCGPGREFAIVQTKLEEAAFFAKKAMAKQPENQLVPVPA